MFSTTQTHFEHIANHVTEPTGRNRILSYVWLMKDEPPKKHNLKARNSAFENPMPNKYINNISSVAYKNFDTTIIIWVELNALNEKQKRFLEWFRAQYQNIEIRDINDVERYKENIYRAREVHKIPTADPFWQKVDYTRLLVLDHLLEVGAAEEVFYSDTDIIDPPLSSEKTHAFLDQFGLVFAKCEGRKAGAYLENQFMGFRAEGRSFLTGLIHATRVGIEEKGYNGWTPLCQYVRQNFSAVDNTLDCVTVRTREMAVPESVAKFIDYPLMLRR